jgi:hypothetical protein
MNPADDKHGAESAEVRNSSTDRPQGKQRRGSATGEGGGTKCGKSAVKVRNLSAYSVSPMPSADVQAPALPATGERAAFEVTPCLVSSPVEKTRRKVRPAQPSTRGTERPCPSTQAVAHRIAAVSEARGKVGEAGIDMTGRVLPLAAKRSPPADHAAASYAYRARRPADLTKEEHQRWDLLHSMGAMRELRGLLQSHTHEGRKNLAGLLARFCVAPFDVDLEELLVSCLSQRFSPTPRAAQVHYLPTRAPVVVGHPAGDGTRT